MSAEAVVAADLTERNRRANAIAFGVMVALIAIAPFVAYPFFIMQALCFALFACAFNLLIGYVGLLSFGHAMFLGLASYVCAHAAKVWGLEPVSAIALGVLASGVLGLVTGALAIRSSGIYFAMITVAFSQMVYFFCVEAPFTHGEDGIQAVPQGRALGLFDLSNPWILYVFVAVIFLFGFLAVQRIVNSPFGEILKAIRENEPRVVSLGYRAMQYKLAAFTLSAAIAGLAGATKAIVAQNASLTDVSFAMSGEVVLMTLVGGMGTFYGPVVGAFIVVSMQNYLAQYGEWVTVIQGVVFVACVLVFRRGIVGELAAR
ncbi:branched-chain amino acid ABC transporter permease, partial [Roseiarcus sp.]|uniref:branched-chain amino acid ABC transporter permease n=1 Tax=Roseiarcus sp. TaxID=1969460 RepID=UPI003F94A872